MWFKLSKCGVSGKMLKIIMSMYKCVKTRIVVDGEKSEPFDCKLGVRQGECLSPFLFAIYINDMENSLNHEDAGVSIADIKILLLFYADDVVIFSETPSALQGEIDRLSIYCQKWKLKLNTVKSQIVVFKRGNNPVKHQWHFGEHELKATNIIPYLGILFSSNGSFYQAQKKLSEQAGKALFSLRKKLGRFRNLKPSFLLDIFDKFIVPILNYACEIWGFHKSPDIERIHLKFCKLILGVRKTCQNDFVYNELGRYPMVLYRESRIVKYWLNIVHGNKSAYVNSLYQSSVTSMDVTNTASWARSVKSLLFTHGFGDVWLNQGVGDTETFLRVFRERIFDGYRQNIRASINVSTRARFYSAVRSEHKYQPYLDIVIPQAHRVALSRLILSSHSLCVETGRWARPIMPLERRYCNFCQHKLEDEYHVLFECCEYKLLRDRFFPTYYAKRPSMFKCAQMLNSSSKQTMKSVAKYVYMIFDRRQTLMMPS